MKPLPLLVGLGCLAAVALGLSKLRLEADIFGLLPPDLAEIEALRIYNSEFGGDRELMISLRGPGDRDATRTLADSLAQALDTPQLGSQLVWRNPLVDDAKARAELLAWLWFNQPPARFDEFATRFDEDQLDGRLAAAMERIATAFDPNEIGRTLMDPLGFTDIGAQLDGGAGLRGLAEQDPFASADGQFRVLFLRAPRDLPRGFGAAGDWIANVEATAKAWSLRQAAPVEVRLGGTTAIDAEFGRGIVADMELAAVCTLSLVALLFWVVHRRFRPLLWLSVLLVFVLAATISAGNALFGGLNVISLGFAAILLGLGAGYGLLLYQELADAPDKPPAAHRRAVGPSIAWASATTAGAFLMVGRSSLPGMIQLGVMVALGIAIAGAVMVAAYLGPLARMAPAAERHARKPLAATLARMPRRVWIITALTGLLALVALAVQPPGLDAGTEPLGPRHSEAREAMTEIEAEIGTPRRSFWVITAGPDYATVGERLARTGQSLATLAEDGTIARLALPTALWPQPGHQQANRQTAAALAGRREAVLAAMAEAGFADDSLSLTDHALASYARLAGAAPPALPQAAGLQWLFQRFMNTPGRDEVMALGRIELADDASPDALRAISAELLERDHTRLASWQLASRSLLGTMKTDVANVLVPMIIVLLVLLGLAFRRVGDVLLSVATLAFSCLALFAVMGLTGLSWNLMNIMALPLLLGVAVDYSIHVQLALQRHDGDVVQMQRTVGRAIILAGTTTAIGFGSLGLASNAGLASLGLVCAAGVALTCAVSTLLLPVWWSAVNRKPLVSL